MKKSIIRSGLTITLAAVMGMAVLTGCGSKDASEMEIVDEKTALFSEPITESDSAEITDMTDSENGPEYSVYEDANGWSIKYDANDFAVMPENGQVFIVYQGESAGTNMITVTYTTDNDAEGAVKELGNAYGDKATYIEGTFPGTEDVKGYWVCVDPDTEGSGAFMTAIARDYMEGALVFETDGHFGDDEENNMAVSDALAGIIDSLEFSNEN